MHPSEIWNSCFLPCPQPFATTTPLNIATKKKLTAIRSELYDLLHVLNLHCLHVEAAALSRYLYRNYRKLGKDKGFQLLKMVMTALNKYLRMKVSEEMELTRDVIPANFSPLDHEYCLPTREAFGWLLARIQASIAVFYRIFCLCKKAGRKLYARLRLRWCPGLLIFALGLVARIYVLARHIVRQLVASYNTLVPLVRSFVKIEEDSIFKDYPRDIRASFGGLDDVMTTAKRVSNAVDMTMQLIDLTEDDAETEQREFIETLKSIQGGDEDEEVQRICEVVNLDATARRTDADVMEVGVVSLGEEDIGEPVMILDSKDVIELSSSDYGDGGQSSSQGNSGKRGKRRALKTPRKMQHFNKKTKFSESIDLTNSSGKMPQQKIQKAKMKKLKNARNRN